MTINYNNAQLGQSIRSSGTKEILFISSDNKVGINTNAPSGQLDISGLLISSSGNFTNSLQVNGIDVSLSGHTHTSSNITDFNSSVSGLLPIISNSGDNRLLTSTGSTVGINAENNLTFDGSLLSVSGNFVAQTGTINSLNFNDIGDPAIAIRQLTWNNSEGSLQLGLSNNYAMFIGGELHYRVRNNTDSTLLAGTAVYATGLTPGGNNRIEIAPKAADGSIREVRFMGLMTEDCNSGFNGYTTHFGYIRGLDTRGDASANGTTNKLWASGEPSWTEGDILYVHPTVAGKLTKIEPKHSISVAIILNRHQNQGKLFVRPTSYGHLSDNHDVDTSGATNGQFLQYNSSTDYWIPSNSGNFSSLQVNGTGVSISSHTHTSSNITDFNVGVSGLLPTISNSGDNRILTSTGSTVGINAESNLTFDGNNLTAPYLVSSYSSGDEGGEIQLAKPPNGTLSGGITIDAYQNRLRFFEQGGSARGFYLDLSSAGAGVSTNLAAGGGSATSVSNYADNRVITSDGTTAGLNAESNFTFNGSLLTAPSGNFTSSLQVNSINVSISGHTHTSSNITDFNSSVSGLLSKTISTFTARDNYPPATNYATLDTRNSVLVLEFDAATEESATFIGVIPENASLPNGLIVRLWWMGDTATSGNVRWGVQFEDTGTDLDTDSYDTNAQVTSETSGTSGIESVASITITTIDSLAGGDRFRLRVYRVAADATNDTMTGDAQLVAVEVRAA
jgi:hypothetical protein